MNWIFTKTKAGYQWILGNLKKTGVALLTVVIGATVYGASLPEPNYGNLIIKVGNSSSFEDGDIIHAFNREQILNTHTQHIVHPKNMARNSNGAIQPNSLLETYLENTKEYKFERISETEVRRTNLWTSDIDIISNTPNINGEYMDVALYIKRRLTLKPNQNNIFGNTGSEYWYGGGTDVTNAKLDTVWTDIESKTAHKKEDYKEFPFTEKELSKYLVIKVDDFTKAQAGEYTAPEYGTDGETVLKRRKYKIDRTTLGFSGKELNDVASSAIKYDKRATEKHSLNVIKLK